MLSKGVSTRADVSRGQRAALEVKVNGDPGYEATTTRRAVGLLLDDLGESCSVALEQSVDVPVGHGFGASAASALSAVLAVSSALGLDKSREQVAYYAHAADILCRTGLGTVSAIYKNGGAGLIVKAGAPGVAELRVVPVPDGIKIVTASLAPYRKSAVLSSPKTVVAVNKLGDEALARADDLTIESLVRAGEIFADLLGLESPEVRRLNGIARGLGAIGASQNMVGHAIHALVWEDDVEQVAAALASDPSAPLVNVYGFDSGPRLG